MGRRGEVAERYYEAAADRQDQHVGAVARQIGKRGDDRRRNNAEEHRRGQDQRDLLRVEILLVQPERKVGQMDARREENGREDQRHAQFEASRFRESLWIKRGELHAESGKSGGRPEIRTYQQVGGR